MTNLTNIDQLSNLSEKEKEYANIKRIFRIGGKWFI